MSRLQIGSTTRRARLAKLHRLTPTQRTDDVVAIADDLVALHSSDPATVFLSAASRMINPSITRIERALYDDRSLIRHHAMRRTLWVSSAERTQQAHASSTRKVAASERKRLIGYLRRTEWVSDAEAFLAGATAELMDLIAIEGPSTARHIGRTLPHLSRPLTAGSANRPAEVSAHTRLLYVVGLEGLLVRSRPTGSWVGSEYLWNLASRWLDFDLEALDTRSASAALIQAWLRTFGPGTETDMRWWTGWTATAVRTALSDTGAVEVELEHGQVGWVAADDPLAAGSDNAHDVAPWVCLLPSLDPTTMGWKDRHWYLDSDVAERVFDRNGNAGPTVWADGKIVGGWAQRTDGSLALELQRKLDPTQQIALESEVARITEFIGETRFRVRFPSPNQKDLLS